MSEVAAEADTVARTLIREGVVAEVRGYLEEEGQDWKEERLEKDRFLTTHLFAPQKVQSLDEGTLRQIVRRLWAYSNWTNKDYVLEQMLESGLPTIRLAFETLLYSDDALADRFDRVRQDVRQMGAASISEILCHFEKSRYAIWNSRAREGLIRLGVSDDALPATRQISGVQYERFCKLMRRILEKVKQEEHFVEDLFVLDYLLYYLSAVKEDGPTPVPGGQEGPADDFDHDEIIEKVLELGDGLGFEVDDEVPVAPRAQVDAIWRTRIANLGTISYAFEVHRKGSPDSAILNLLKVIQQDASIRKGVLVSTKSEIERFRSEVESLKESFGGSVGYLEVPQLLTALEHLDGLKGVLADLGLLEQVV